MKLYSKRTEIAFLLSFSVRLQFTDEKSFLTKCDEHCDEKISKYFVMNAEYNKDFSIKTLHSIT